MNEKSKKAQVIARIISGTWDWQGTRDVVGPSGMKGLITRHLRTMYLTRGTGMRCSELSYGDGTSKYFLDYDRR